MAYKRNWMRAESGIQHFWEKTWFLVGGRSPCLRQFSAQTQMQSFNNLQFKRNAVAVAMMLIECENKSWIEAEMADDWKKSLENVKLAAVSHRMKTYQTFKRKEPCFPHLLHVSTSLLTYKAPKCKSCRQVWCSACLHLAEAALGYLLMLLYFTQWNKIKDLSPTLCHFDTLLLTLANKAQRSPWTNLQSWPQSHRIRPTQTLKKSPKYSF